MRKILFLFLIPFLIYAQDATKLLLFDDASFLPSDIPNLTVWIDPAVEYCEGVPPEYNDIIDRSGNGNDATLFNQASWYADSCNNLPAIYFDGSDDYILISDSFIIEKKLYRAYIYPDELQHLILVDSGVEKYYTVIGAEAPDNTTLILEVKREDN